MRKKVIVSSILVISILLLSYWLFKWFVVSDSLKKYRKSSITKENNYVNDTSSFLPNRENIDTIITYLRSTNISEIHTAIAQLTAVSNAMERKKAKIALERLWENGFPQFEETEKGSMQFELEQLRIKLAGSLFQLTKMEKYRKYLVMKIATGSSHEKSSAEMVLNNIDMVEKEIASNLDKEPPSSIKTVKEMLQGNSFPESNTAITAIPELYPDSQAKQMLLGIWNSVPSNSYDIDSVSLKMNSAVQLWSLGEKKYLPFVFEQIEHGNLTLKTRGIDLLSNVNSEKSRNVLREVIKNNNEIPMVIFAIKSLGEIGKSKDIALLDKVKAKNIQGMNEPIENAKSSINERITIKK